MLFDALKSLVLACAIGLLPFVANASSSVCPEMIVEFVGSHPEFVDLESIRSEYTLHGGATSRIRDPSIEGQRFVLFDQWIEDINSGIELPWNTYSAQTFSAWARGAKFVQSNFSDFTVSSAPLKRIHKVTSEGMYYRGFERRRIESAFKRNLITEKQFALMNASIDRREEVYYSGVDHETLGGKFREDVLDNDITNGMPLRTHNKGVTGEQLHNLKQLPGLRVKKVAPAADGFLEVTLSYPTTAEVEKLVDASMDKAKAVLDDPSTSLDSKVKAISDLQIELLSIHPFLNGNGRAIRLFGDGLYMKLGLPPPVHLTDDDFLLSRTDLVRYTKVGMYLYNGNLP